MRFFSLINSGSSHLSEALRTEVILGYKQNNKTSAFMMAVWFLFILCCLTLNPARAVAAVDINIASFTDTSDPVPSLGQFDYDSKGYCINIVDRM